MIALFDVNLGQNVLQIFLIRLHENGNDFKYFDERCREAIITPPSST